MPYNFSRTDDYVIIEHAIDQYYAVTRESAVVTGTSTSISIDSDNYSRSAPLSDIGTIDGVTPTGLQDAVQRLGILFRGYPPFKITVE